MAVLLLKLGLTPALVGLATLVSRRWGPAIGGLLVALPLTSGPVLFFLALDHGTTFATAAAEGSIAGAAAVAAFCLAYAWVGRSAPWWGAFLAGTAGYAAMSVAMQPFLAGPVVVLVVAAASAQVGALHLLPQRVVATGETAPPWWDIPARMVVGAAIVLGVTGIATVLGPRMSGLVATFPAFVTVLAVFTHRREGPSRTVPLMRGVLIGMFGSLAFFVSLVVLLVPWGLVLAFPAAVIAAFAVQVTGLRVLRRG